VSVHPISGQASPYTLYQYDANGRMSRRERKYAVGGTIQTYDFFWDGDDRLRQVKQGGASRFQATYDGDGLRVTKTDLFSATYTYSRGPGGVLYDGATTYTPGLGHRYTGINPRFYHSDWVGSTRYLSDSSGNFFPSALRYDAFGQRTALAGPNQPTPFQFAGGWGYEAEYSDSTEPYLGLSYLQERYYEPATGRFISRDPIGLASGLNLYAYCGNDPVNGVDPEGLLWRERLAFAGGIFGGLAGATEFGVGAVPGVVIGTGLGAYIGSRLDGEPIGQSAVNGGCDAALSYVGGRVGAAVAGRLGPVLARIPRPALKLRGGFARIPVGGIARSVWRGHAVADDWAVKGAHVTVNGVELAVRPGAGGSIVFKPVFSGDAARAGQAIQTAQELLKDPKFVADLLARVIQARSYVLNLPNAGGVGRSAELHFLQAILRRILGGL
jgi:RHS repeat-associated protein